MRSRNHGSIPVAAASASTLTPRRNVASTSKGRWGVAVAERAISSSMLSASSATSCGSALRPRRPCSRPRTAFWKDSAKVRPIAITSPTDCIRVPSRSGAPGSFSKAQRGIFVTT
jgi:hypothetical protein